MLCLTFNFIKGNIAMNERSRKLKELSVKEFTRSAEIYEGNNAGVYELCKKDYPDILAELETEDFTDLLDAGCGPAPMLSLLTEKYPDKHYTGIDLTPKMIEVARAKHLPNTSFVVGDCEDLPFDADSFDAIICSMSFHHYPEPELFFSSVKKCLRPGGRLILRDMTGPAVLVALANLLEMPLANLTGHGDARAYTISDIQKLCDGSGLILEKGEQRKGLRLHCVIRKPR